PNSHADGQILLRVEEANGRGRGRGMARFLVCCRFLAGATGIVGAAAANGQRRSATARPAPVGGSGGGASGSAGLVGSGRFAQARFPAALPNLDLAQI